MNKKQGNDFVEDVLCQENAEELQSRRTFETVLNLIPDVSYLKWLKLNNLANCEILDA
jgi:hypothetical protein